jgi:hypothetical protein
MMVQVILTKAGKQVNPVELDALRDFCDLYEFTIKQL